MPARIRQIKQLPMIALAYTVAILCLANGNRGVLGQEIVQDRENSNAHELSSEQLTLFETKIRPVLIDSCYRCHSGEEGQTRGGLAIDSKEGSLRGGDSGPAIVPGSLDESLLWSAINFESYEMPPSGPLPDEVIADFRRWIEMGAPDPRVGEALVVNTKVTAEQIDEGKEFWSFQKPIKSTLPMVQDSSWPRNEIDHFVLKQLEQADLQPAHDAEAHTLVRRLYYDLIGLPPTPKQIGDFKRAWQDDQDLAVESLVDQLLESPQFGERWGRHWLDVARYAESAGKELNAPFSQAWRYRDYVIDAFNEDKPYDEFIREQIAGDLLPVDSDEEWAEHLTATGFLAIGPKTLTEQNPRQFEQDLADEQIDVTTRVVLGISVACARCHDHKFDPIPQSDYYAMSGIFRSMKTYYGTLDATQNRRPSDLIILPVDDPSPLTERLTRREIAELKEELEEARIAYADGQRQRREQQARARRNPDSQPSVLLTLAQLNQQKQRVAVAEARLRSVDANGNPRALAMGVQSSNQPTKSRVLVRGELNQPAQEVEHGFVQVIGPEVQSLKTSSESRLELADWMTDEDNPLTARVMVNRIWLHLMGEGIVRSPENFGSTGQLPTHAELLDYLAIQFMDANWSVKTMVRSIATSRAYRMSSGFDRASFEADPENKLLWRHPPRRLDAESIRDSMLVIGGQIDLNRPQASQVALAQSEVLNGDPARGRQGMARNRAFARGATSPFSSDDSPFEFTRSIYLPIVRDQVPHELEVFDFAEPSMVIGQRDVSNTPSQALYLLNNEFVVAQSRALAERIVKESTDPERQIQTAFEWVYGRLPNATELQATQAFAADMAKELQQTRRVRDANEQVLQLICQGLFASAEFRFVD